VVKLLAHELNEAAAVRAMEAFPGLAHRLQCVHTWSVPAAGGEGAGSGAGREVRFYNDSKATSPDASMTAVQAFAPRSAIFIVGGYDKHIDMSAVESLLAQRAGGVIGIGQTGQSMVENVRRAAAGAGEGGAGGVEGPRVEYAGTLEAAVALARKWVLAAEGGGDRGAGVARPLNAIVLSPASASWDQFPNYEKRGEQFALLSRQVGGNGGAV